jgi:hypothetical protein
MLQTADQLLSDRRSMKEDWLMNNTSIATGFNFQPLPDGNLLIEFCGDDGNTLNEQVVTAEVVKRIPFVAVMTEVALQKGPDVAKKIMEELSQIGRLFRRDASRSPRAEPALTKKEVARLFQVSTRTLDRWRSMGVDLGELTIEGTIRFDPAKVADIIATQKLRRTRRS